MAASIAQPDGTAPMAGKETSWLLHVQDRFYLSVTAHHSFCLLVQYLENTSLPEFADVFDPAGDPQQAMVGMMKVRDIPYAHINFTYAMRV